MLVYGSTADSVEQNVYILESSVPNNLKRFCKAIVAIYKEEYNKISSDTGAQKLSDEYSVRGFPDCLGCVECSGWVWQNCPMLLARAYTGRNRRPTI